MSGDLSSVSPSSARASCGFACALLALLLCGCPEDGAPRRQAAGSAAPPAAKKRAGGKQPPGSRPARPGSAPGACAAVRPLPVLERQDPALGGHLSLPRARALALLRRARRKVDYLPKGAHSPVGGGPDRARLLFAGRGMEARIDKHVALARRKGLDAAQRRTLLAEAARDIAHLALVDRRRARRYLPHLIRSAGSKDPGVIHDAAHAVGFYGPHARRAVPALIRAHGRVKGQGVHAWRVLQALGRIGDRRALPLLVGALSNRADDSWRAAAAAAAYLRRPAFVKKALYLDLLRREQSHVRAAMVSVFEHLAAKEPWAARALAAAELDPDSAVRSLAAEASIRVKCRAGARR